MLQACKHNPSCPTKDKKKSLKDLTAPPAPPPRPPGLVSVLLSNQSPPSIITQLEIEFSIRRLDAAKWMKMEAQQEVGGPSFILKKKQKKKSQTLQSLMNSRLPKLVFVVTKCAFCDDVFELIFLLERRRCLPPCLQPLVICSLFFFPSRLELKRREDVLKVPPFYLWQGDDMTR